jgi:hypothetical protein
MYGYGWLRYEQGEFKLLMEADRAAMRWPVA